GPRVGRRERTARLHGGDRRGKDSRRKTRPQGGDRHGQAQYSVSVYLYGGHQTDDSGKSRPGSAHGEGYGRSGPLLQKQQRLGREDHAEIFARAESHFLRGGLRLQQPPAGRGHLSDLRGSKKHPGDPGQYRSQGRKRQGGGFRRSALRGRAEEERVHPEALRQTLRKSEVWRKE